MSDSTCTIHNVAFNANNQECGFCFDEQKKKIERLEEIIKDGIDVIDQEGNAFAWMEAARRALEADDE
jgi:hypothetical protein